MRLPIFTMRVLSLGLAALLGRAVAVDSCTQANSGSCCKGYTYNDVPIHLRATAPVCDESVPPGPGVTCGGHAPVCTAIDRIPEGSFHGTLYCGNPFPNEGSGTINGTISVEVGLCPSPMNGYCFILTATAPAGTTLKADFKVQISTALLMRDNPGQFATKVTTQPVYVPFSLVYGASYPCDTLGPKTVDIGFHAEEGTETCWAGSDDRNQLMKISSGNNNWALQFTFTYMCKEICKSYCCCPAPPTVPDCPADYSESCPSKCDTPGAQCKTIPIPNLPNWGSQGSLYAEKCCCKPPDNPGDCTAPFTIRNVVDPGTPTCPASSSQLFCKDPLKGSIANCHTGLYNEVCCCCSLDYSACAAPAVPSPGACSGSPPPPGCTTKTDNCGNQFCCCQATVGTCSTETAFGVPSVCNPNTICDAAHYPGVITLKSKGCGRWGWVIDTGDLAAAGSKTYKLHQGAGQNDLSHGDDVGSVTIKHCTEGSTTWCAFFSTTNGNVITSAHVEADCDALSTRTTQNFPCAPGGYNNNGGNSCGTNGLPGTSWTSQPFSETCNSNHYFVILHAAVAKNDPDCTSTNCGDQDQGLGSG